MMLFVIIAAVLGLGVGSFLNVLTLRLMSGEPIVMGRSACPHCHARLAARDLIPVVSYLALRGRCRSCHAPISPWYAAVELSTAACFALVALHSGPALLMASSGVMLQFFAQLVLTAGFIALFVFDVRWLVVPDVISLPLAVFALAANLTLGVAWQSLLLGALIGGGGYALLWIASRGRWVGDGDIRLGVLLGAALGAWGAALALYLAIVSGGLVAAILVLSGRRRVGEVLPMGAFLTLAGFVVMLYSKQIFIALHPYLGL